MLTEATEDYLKAIFSLSRKMDRVPTSAIAARLKVAPASVTQMIKKLDGMKPKLVEYQRHRGVTLTAHGERVAIEVIRHHRLIELFLHESLGMRWDEVDREAERLEHVISTALADRIADALGDPKYDPHGDPIPPKGGRMPADDLIPLRNLEAGQRGTVRRVSDQDPEMLRYLGGLGIVPGTEVLVAEKAPFDGPIHVALCDGGNGERHALGQRVAGRVYVEAGT